jgi:hypothetical protein
MRHKECPGRFDDRGNFGHLCYRQRRQASLIEDALNQSDGLLADRSGWREQHQIYHFFQQLTGNIRRGFPH